jgi:NitT/TauT family transport system substrate-binding protein
VLEFAPGSGANNTAPRMTPEGFDAGFGDINALADLVANGVAGAPLAVFSVFPATPNAVVVRANGSITAPAQLAGRALISHPTDTALHTFPAYARAAGIDAASVKIETANAPMSDFVQGVVAGRHDGAFGWVNTLVFSARAARIDPEALRFLRFREVLPDLHGGAIMVSRKLAADRPDVVRALLVACRAGIETAKADPDAAMAALKRRVPDADMAAHKERMLGTLTHEMAHPDVARLGLGAVDAARLGRSFAQVAEARGWPRAPAADEVFSPAFLPG